MLLLTCGFTKHCAASLVESILTGQPAPQDYLNASGMLRRPLPRPEWRHWPRRSVVHACVVLSWAGRGARDAVAVAGGGGRRVHRGRGRARRQRAGGVRDQHGAPLCCSCCISPTPCCAAAAGCTAAFRHGAQRLVACVRLHRGAAQGVTCLQIRFCNPRGALEKAPVSRAAPAPGAAAQAAAAAPGPAGSARAAEASSARARALAAPLLLCAALLMAA
jgi:hypothetical protein